MPIKSARTRILHMSPVDRMRLINKRKDIGKRRRQQSSRIWAAMQQRYQALRNNRDA